MTIRTEQSLGILQLQSGRRRGCALVAKPLHILLADKRRFRTQIFVLGPSLIHTVRGNTDREDNRPRSERRFRLACS